jgi:ketosteroid isomerase-like protein
VFVIATRRGQGRASGAPVATQMSYVFTVRDRKVVRYDVYPSREEALEAAGLSQ